MSFSVTGSAAPDDFLNDSDHQRFESLSRIRHLTPGLGGDQLDRLAVPDDVLPEVWGTSSVHLARDLELDRPGAGTSDEVRICGGDDDSACVGQLLGSGADGRPNSSASAGGSAAGRSLDAPRTRCYC